VSKTVVDIVHFSDVLCIWAYVAQIRVEELQNNFPEEVRVDYRFLQVFGDVGGKMAAQWADCGGLAGYADLTAQKFRSRYLQCRRGSRIRNQLETLQLPVFQRISFYRKRKSC
jgi:hypothetical protein